ncbi:hypothetical protein A410_0306 [Listeria monocytogenes serotype 1/2b str. 10-0811]|nr:hypothetical protein A410_0306 [Listeria monocytogenes serotype 1/2b str. 10-0811]
MTREITLHRDFIREIDCRRRGSAVWWSLSFE